MQQHRVRPAGCTREGGSLIWDVALLKFLHMGTTLSISFGLFKIFWISFHSIGDSKFELPTLDMVLASVGELCVL